MATHQTQLPATVYAVGLLYEPKHSPGRLMLATRTVIVPGVKPLTDDEARGRAAREVEAEEGSLITIKHAGVSWVTLEL